jgi:hypothetical protein
MSESVYNPILDLLAEHKAKTLAQIETGVSAKGVNFAQVVQAVMALIGAGHLVPVQDEAVIAKAKKATDKVNAYLIDKARGNSEISYLGSPVSGGGVAVGRFPKLFLLALSQGKKSPEDWAQLAWEVLAVQGQRLVRDGATLERAEDNLAELTAQARVFAEKELPMLKALQIV